MAQNLREMFKNAPKNDAVTMSEGHEARFLNKLETALPDTKNKTSRYGFLNIAASIVMVLGVTYGAFTYINTPNTPPVNPLTHTDGGVSQLKTMGDISPDLKKVEDYYLASIHLELSKIKLTPENKELFDGYIARLKELNVEYNNLTVELNDNGPNPITLDALIENLKLRLNLVMQLKQKLEEYNAEAFNSQHIT